MIEEIDYIKRYDELLKIKPSYGIKRIINPVNYDYVGVEIEIAINYDRERYSLIRTLLKKIIKTVGQNGYFVKDGTIIGDYSFEIILDPLPVKKFIKIYKTILMIVDFSDGSIAFNKENNCGLHLNFNKYDILNKEKVHKDLLLFIKDNNKYFEENVYKKVVYNYNLEEYIKIQKSISGKYVGVNYLNKRVLEIRNVKVNLTPNELLSLINKLLSLIFYDRYVFKKEDNNITINNLVEFIIDNKNKEQIEEKLNNDEIVFIIENNKFEIKE